MGKVKKQYDLYGVFADNIEAARSLVERTIGLEFQAHESSYRGGAYFRLYDVGREHFILQRNYDDFEGEWFEQKYREVPFILYVNDTRRSDELREALTAQSSIRLLRHEEV